MEYQVNIEGKDYLMNIKEKHIRDGSNRKFYQADIVLDNGEKAMYILFRDNNNKWCEWRPFINQPELTNKIGKIIEKQFVSKSKSFWLERVSGLVLISIGSLILFGSWIAQNIYRNDVDSKREELKFTQQNLVELTIARDLYELQSNAEEFFCTKDTSFVSQLRHSYFIYSTTVNEIYRKLGHNIDLPADSVKFVDSAYLATKFKLDAANDKMNVGLLQKYKEANHDLLDGKDYFGYKNRFLMIYEKATITSSFWNFFYIGLYIVGTILIAIPYLRKHFLR
ncbi:MAG TPA: hypothetical protein VK543_11495 [Puia sp.]|nr:hypothetical protein [Puia sp.]